jgi:hypothetical protein
MGLPVLFVKTHPDEDTDSSFRGALAKLVAPKIPPDIEGLVVLG